MRARTTRSFELGPLAMSSTRTIIPLRLSVESRIALNAFPGHEPFASARGNGAPADKGACDSRRGHKKNVGSTDAGLTAVRKAHSRRFIFIEKEKKRSQEGFKKVSRREPAEPSMPFCMAEPQGSSRASFEVGRRRRHPR